jgi:hypothetical protein
MSYISPSFKKKAFTCPHCAVYARQYRWGHYLDGQRSSFFQEGSIDEAPLKISICENCGKKLCMGWGGIRISGLRKCSASES